MSELLKGLNGVVKQIEDDLREIRSLERTEVQDKLDLRQGEREHAPDLDSLPEDDPLSALEREFLQPPFNNRLDPRLDYLDNMEGRPADAIKGLQSYDFLSPEAETKYKELLEGFYAGSTAGM